MIASGANMKYLQHQMGHSSIRVTMDMYGHLLPEVGEGVGKKLDSLIWDSKVVPFPEAENGPKKTSEAEPGPNSFNNTSNIQEYQYCK